MEENKQTRVSLGGVVSIFIIVLLIIGLVGMYYYYNYVVIPKYEVAKNNETENILESNNNEVEEKSSQEEEVSPYGKYEELYWQFKDNEEDKTNTEFDGKKIQIEDGKVYLYVGNNKTEITSIDGKAKFIHMWGEQTLERVYVLTEEGTIWKSICEDGLNSEFTKVSITGKVIDITNGNSSIRIVEPPYFLLDNGELVNEEGSNYEELDGNFVKSFGNSYSVIFVKEDNTMYSYDYETRKYIQIKDENGEPVEMKDAFLQWSTTRNNLVDETEGEDRIFVITEDDKLFYFDGYSNVTAREYKETAGKIIKSAVEENQEHENGSTTNIRITFVDGTEEVLIDANRNFFGN